MAVLLEAISVIVKRSSINLLFPGGWELFKEIVPNNTLCFDNEIARVGFMHTDDVESFVKKLETMGLRYFADGETHDLTVIDQRQVVMMNTPWIETATLHLEEFGGPVSACQLADSTDPRLITPERWKYSGSMSQTNGFIATEDAEKHLQFLRSENGLNVFLDTRTGKELFIGRPNIT